MTSTHAHTSKGEGEIARALRRFIELRGGLAPAAADLGLSREAIARYLARLDMQPGTRERLERTVRSQVLSKGDRS